MSEKRMLIVDAELVKKVDDNRGDMDRSDFINFLIETQLSEKEERAIAQFSGILYQLWVGARQATWR